MESCVEAVGISSEPLYLSEFSEERWSEPDPSIEHSPSMVGDSEKN